MWLRSEGGDSCAQVLKVRNQTERADAQSGRTAVLSLQEDRHGKLCRDRGLANALLAMDQNARLQDGGRCVNAAQAYAHQSSSDYLV